MLAFLDELLRRIAIIVEVYHAPYWISRDENNQRRDTFGCEEMPVRWDEGNHFNNRTQKSYHFLSPYSN